jgi:HEAT repeat protein
MSRQSCAALLLAAAWGLAAAQPPAEKEPSYDGKTVSDWVRALDGADPAERRAAMSALRALGGQPDAVAEKLLAAAADPKSRTAAHILAIGEFGPAAVPALTRGLWSDDRRTRQVALFALTRLGADGRAAAPSLVRLLADPDESVRREAAEALANANAHSAMTALTTALGDREAAVRLTAAEALVRLGAPASAVLPALTAELAREDADTVRRAVLVLRELGPEAAPAVPELVKLVPRDDPELTIRLCAALGAIGPGAKEAAPALKKRLADDKHRGHEIGLDVAVALWRTARDPDAAKILREQVANSTRPQQVAEALWRIDSGEETVKALTELLKSDKPEVAIAAAGVLGARAKEALPTMARMLAHKEPNVRARAVVALVRLREDGRAALDALRGTAKDDNPSIAFWSAVAVCRLDPKPEAVAAVAGYLDDRDADLRRSAAEVLGQLGGAAAPARPRLTLARTDADGQTRLAAAMAAWKALSDFESLQTAAELLRSPDVTVRSLAAVDIGGIVGPGAKPIVPEVVKRLFDPFAVVRSSATEALGRIGPAAKDSAPALLALLDGDEPAFVQSAACEALGLLEPADKDAAAATLKKKLDHADPLTRTHAALALHLVAGDRTGEKEADRGLAHRSHHVRITSAELLWRLRQDARVVPLLVRTLEESNLDGRSDENERYMAARLLGRIGAPAKPAVPELRKLLTHPDPALAEAAAEAHKAIDPEAAKKAGSK